MTVHPSRRQVLFAAAVAGGAGALAACSSSAAKPSAATSSAPAAAGGGSAQAVAKLADVAVGKTISVKLPDGKPGVLTRTGAKEVVCFSAICTHQGCTVAPAGGELQCPCHGSVFDARTGKPKSGPAPSPLPAVQVKVEGADVVTA